MNNFMPINLKIKIEIDKSLEKHNPLKLTQDDK